MRKKKNIIDLVFVSYLVFILIINYCVYTQLNYFQLFVDAYSETLFYKIQLSDFYSLKEMVLAISIPNLVFNGVLWMTDDYIFSSHFTCSIIFVFVLLLIYVLSSNDRSNIFGLFAVFIFSTFPIVIENSKVNDWHFFEVMYILLLIYLYLKSEDFSRFWYSLFYVLVLVDAFSGEWSIFLYIVTLIALNIYFVFESKKILKWHCFLFLSGFIVVVYVCNCLEAIPLAHLMTYCAEKLPAWLFLNNLSVEVFRVTILKLFDAFYRYLSPLYFYLVVILFIVDIVFIRTKRRSKLDRLVNFFILILFIVHFFSSFPVPDAVTASTGVEATRLYDIIPIFAFIVIRVASIMELIWVNGISKFGKKWNSLEWIKTCLAFFVGGIFFIYGVYGVSYWRLNWCSKYTVSLAAPWILTKAHMWTENICSDMMAYLQFQLQRKNKGYLVLLVEGQPNHDTYTAYSFLAMRRVKFQHIWCADEIDDLSKTNVFLVKRTAETEAVIKKLFALIKQRYPKFALRKIFHLNYTKMLEEKYKVYW